MYCVADGSILAEQKANALQKDSSALKTSVERLCLLNEHVSLSVCWSFLKMSVHDLTLFAVFVLVQRFLVLLSFSVKDF